MSVRQPRFVSLLKMTEGNFPFIRDKVLAQDFLTADNAESLIRQFAPAAYKRIDDPVAPVFMDDKTTRVYLWADPADEENPRKMVAIYAKVTREGDHIDVKPEMLIKGPDANFVLFYQMSCCAGMSAIACFSTKGEQRYEIRDSLSGTQKGEGQLFKDKVRIATSPELLDQIKHMYLDVARKPHDCGGHLSYGKGALKQGGAAKPVFKCN